MPQWVRRIILGRLGRMFGIKTRLHQKQNDESNNTVPNTLAIDTVDAEDNTIILKSIATIGTQNGITNSHEDSEEKNDACIMRNGSANEGLKKRRSVKSKTGPATFTTTNEPVVDNVEDWRTASRVLDRFSMVIGFLLAIGTTAGIFLQAPRVRDFFTGKSGI